ncbi:MAG: ribonuclease III domain-containing protein [Candidatus Limivicinus sp.]|jgi:ribonuclease-3 family protein
MTNKALTAKEADGLSMLALAHVGDAVYELLVRSMLTLRGPAQVQDLHRSTVAYVRAEAQAKAAEKILPLLSEEEAAVWRRGRNCRVHGIPPHANPGEYHAATGLEALFGWLYLQGKEERVRALFRSITEE